MHRKKPIKKRIPRGKRFKGVALTYGDVRLIPGYAGFEDLSIISTRTWLTRNIQLPKPFISAAMDTVSEWELCIAMAREGGIGILHKNMTPEQQAEMVRKVKRADSGKITNPHTIGPNGTVKEARQLMDEHHIGGLPVVDDNNKLVGILTNRDLRFEKNEKKKVSLVMTKSKLVTVKAGTTLSQAEKMFRKNKHVEKLPIVNAKGELVGLFTYKDLTKRKQFHDAAKDKLGRLLIGAAVGVGGDYMKRVDLLVAAGVDVIVVDAAHGHSKRVIDAIKAIKKKYPTLDIIGGNVVTREGARALIKAGVDAVKVGLGPGSICTTRIIAGVGVPQVTALEEVIDECAKWGIPVIADGGIEFTGDTTIALAIGADTVMMGKTFAGTDEAPTDVVMYEGQKMKAYRGMGSEGAMKISADRYGRDGTKKLVPEGVEGLVPYAGSVHDVIYNFTEGLRSGMGYCGATTIPDLWKAKYYQITNAGRDESHPHGITITKESRNYSKR